MRCKFWLLLALIAFSVTAYSQVPMAQPIPIPLQTYIFEPTQNTIPIHRMPSELSLTAYYVPGQLSFSDSLAPCQLTIINEADGEVVYFADLADGVTSVALPDLPVGTYLVRFDASDSACCGYLML